MDSRRPAEIVVNHSSASHIPGIEPHRHALDVHRRLPGYQVTPLLDCPALAAALGVGQVWVKDESRRLGLPSFKMLGASYAAYRERSMNRGATLLTFRRLGEVIGLHDYQPDLIRRITGADAHPRLSLCLL